MRRVGHFGGVGLGEGAVNHLRARSHPPAQRGGAVNDLIEELHRAGLCLVGTRQGRGGNHAHRSGTGIIGHFTLNGDIQPLQEIFVITRNAGIGRNGIEEHFIFHGTIVAHEDDGVEHTIGGIGTIFLLHQRLLQPGFKEVVILLFGLQIEVVPLERIVIGSAVRIAVARRTVERIGD